MQHDHTVTPVLPQRAKVWHADIRSTLFLALALLAVSLAQVALAQEWRRLGSVDASLDGEPQRWFLLEYTDEGVSDSMATFTEFAPGFVLVSLQAHEEERYTLQGTLTINMTLMGSFDACPCPVDDVEMMYFTGTSMFSDVYLSEDVGTVSLTLTRFERLSDERIAIAGEFDATLVFAASVMGEPDPETTIRIVGTFETDELRQETLDF